MLMVGAAVTQPGGERRFILHTLQPPKASGGSPSRGGGHHLMETFNETRTHTAAVHVGIAQGAFDRALEYSKQREAFGRKICEFQAIQHKLANMLVKIETARLLVYKAASMIDAGFTPTKWTSMAKLVAGEVAVEVCLEAMQILGGHGYAVEYDVERFFRDGRAGTG